MSSSSPSFSQVYLLMKMQVSVSVWIRISYQPRAQYPIFNRILHPIVYIDKNAKFCVSIEQNLLSTQATIANLGLRHYSLYSDKYLYSSTSTYSKTKEESLKSCIMMYVTLIPLHDMQSIGIGSPNSPTRACNIVTTQRTLPFSSECLKGISTFSQQILQG